jgi:hypothetical protein
MAFYIFKKDLDGIENSIYKIAETTIELDNHNIQKSDYKIIENNTENFKNVILSKRFPLKYNNNTIEFIDIFTKINNKDVFRSKIESFKMNINIFLNANKNHIYYEKWNNYLTQLNNIPYNQFIYPFTKSIEEYFDEQNLPILNSLQLP